MARRAAQRRNKRLISVEHQLCGPFRSAGRRIRNGPREGDCFWKLWIVSRLPVALVWWVRLPFRWQFRYVLIATRRWPFNLFLMDVARPTDHAQSQLFISLLSDAPSTRWFTESFSLWRQRGKMTRVYHLPRLNEWHRGPAQRVCNLFPSLRVQDKHAKQNICDKNGTNRMTW